MRFALFFPLHLSKVLRRRRKIDARSYEVLRMSRKIILANLKIWGSKLQPLSGNHHADLLTAPMKMSLVLRLPRKMHLCRSSSNFPRLPSFLEMLQNPHVFSLLTRCTIPCACHARRDLNVQKWSVHGVLCTCWLRNVLRATMACTFLTSQLPKVVRKRCVLYILTSKCASRRATTACAFSTSQLQKVLLTWGVFCFFTCKCASRHNGVQFFTSHLPSGLRTRRFSEPTFRPSGPRSHNSLEKHSGSRLSYLFAHLHLLSSDSFSSLIFSLLITLLFSLTLPISAFHLSILSEVWLLNFLRI